MLKPPKMLIATRFGLGIKDPAWFEHRLALFSAVTLPSLLNQDDQMFEWVLFVDADLASDVRESLERVLAPFEGRAYLSTTGHTAQSIAKLAQARNLGDSGENLLTGRIDDDDAWASQTVSEVRERVRSWCRSHDDQPGYGVTFKDGLVWLMYDMLDVDQLQRHGREIRREATIRPYTIPFHSMSGFVFSRGGTLTSISAGHSRIPHVLRANGYMVDELDTDKPMWLYCRHKQTESPIHRAQAAPIRLSLPELGRWFGIDESKVAQYLNSANRYGYARVLRKFGARRERVVELREIARRIREDKGIGPDEAATLLDRKAKLESELAELAAHVVSDAPNCE